jgi:hypothetical protein
MTEQLSEETDPELVQFSEPLPSLPPDVQELLEEYEEWLEDYQPHRFIEKGDEEGYKELQSIKPEYIATNHSTCEDEYLTVGFHEFRPGNCCWHESGWYVLKNPAIPDDSVKTSISTHCGDCNLGGDDEGDADCDRCYGDGWTTYYLDEHVEGNLLP